MPKIKTVNQRKVAKWTDENTWEEYAEVGKAMKADMVVGINLEGFSLFQGQTLYQGKANATVRVYDCATRAARWCLKRPCHRPSTRPVRASRPRTGWKSSSAASCCHVLAEQIAGATLRPRSERRRGPAPRR